MISNNSGRWCEDEHERFLEGLHKYGNNWKKIAKLVGTRDNIQCRTHAQKVFKTGEALNTKKKIPQSQNSQNKSPKVNPTLFLIPPQIAPNKSVPQGTVLQFQNLKQFQYVPKFFLPIQPVNPTPPPQQWQNLLNIANVAHAQQLLQQQTQKQTTQLGSNQAGLFGGDYLKQKPVY